MTWPTPQDYNEAVQNPRFAFRDPELQSGTCEVTSLGLPRPITGNFASVYRLRCDSRDWAVRCFWRELSDMQLRYQAISAHLQAAALPYTVGFEYQPHGIKVRGNWYPILKMEWVQGDLLNDYLLAHMHDGSILQALTDHWIQMVAHLEQAKCAHGDLQHGNVLVVGGKLKLVDYDGMYVPALHGMSSHELGQQNYQHPGRSAADFGPTLDRFSTWVIYLSLHALRVDPSLWERTQAGDERLLFKRQDFEDPTSSNALQLLAEQNDLTLSQLSKKFRAALQQPVESMPALSSAVPRALPQTRNDQLSSAHFVWRFQLWWQALVPSAGMNPVPETAQRLGFYPDWVVDYLPKASLEPRGHAGADVRSTRLLTLASFPVAGAGAMGAFWIGATGVAATVSMFLVWIMTVIMTCMAMYRRQPSVRLLIPMSRREIQLRHALLVTERRSRAMSIRLEKCLRRQTRTRERAKSRRAALELQAKEQLDVIVAKRTAALDAIGRHELSIDRLAAERSQAFLREHQSRHVAHALRRATIRRAVIPGIGMAAKFRLWTMGIWAAADVSTERVRALRSEQHGSLVELIGWRVDTEASARRTMPRQLPEKMQQAISRQLEHDRTTLLRERGEVTSSSDATIENVQAALAQRCARLDERLAHEMTLEQQKCSQFEIQRANLAKEASRLKAALHAVGQDIAELEPVSFRRFLQSVFIPGTERFNR